MTLSAHTARAKRYDIYLTYPHYWALSLNCLCDWQDEQVLLSFVFVIKRLLDVIIRDHMRFLLPENQMPQQDEESSASQKHSLAQQQALLRKIPGDFQQVFLETLRAKYVAKPVYNNACCVTVS